MAPDPGEGGDDGPADVGPRYRVEGRIARGGMGTILRVRDLGLPRTLAMKVALGARGADPAALDRRLGHEARIMAVLQHPNIPPVHDAGLLPDGRRFLVMKLVDGATLAALLRRRGDPGSDQGRLLAVFAGVCQAVAYAHSHGVVHRDLKPANVMVGAFGEVQVMDWGLAKALAGGAAAEAGGPAAGDEAAELSQAGSVLGTPAYMSPEQARGAVAEVDRRSDVFALGSMLCEVLTGRPAYLGRMRSEVLGRAAAADLDEARAALGSCGADAEPVALAELCLAAEPPKRPADAGAVAARLASYQSGVEERLRAAELARVEAQARAEEEAKRRTLADELAREAGARAAERSRRRRTAALAAALVGLVALGGGIGVYLARQRAEAGVRARQDLARVEALVGRARQRPDDPARWREARAVAEQVAAGAENRARLAALRREIDTGLAQAEADARLRQALVAARANKQDASPTGTEAA
jgi:serine/threonine-protein kinase